jgi:predicted ATPase/class 3 adenylate cyclase
MERCSVCDDEHRDGTVSGAEDATTTSTSCAACGQPVPPESRFCNRCGARLPDLPPLASGPRPQAEVQQALQSLMPGALADKIRSSANDLLGERRQVTVLYWRIADYAALAQALDSESLHLLTDKAMRSIANVIYEYEGIIDTYAGDGLMALFGLPAIHENDAERAVRAALDMSAAIEPLRRECQEQHGIAFEARVGVHTGSVVAGPITDDARIAYTVVGDTVSLADRLQRAALPGTILASFETYQCTRPWFAYQAAAVRLAGDTSYPVRAFRPLRVRAHPGRVRGLPGLQTPMIGRQDALANLQVALDQVRRSGSGRIVLVSGEAGVGKSRLLSEFRSSVAPSGVRIYQGESATYTRLKPLSLAADVLRDMLYIAETDPPGTQQQALQASAQRLNLASGEVLPYVYNVLGLEQREEKMEARLRHLDDVVLQKLTHAALLQVFERCSRPGPIVVILEDLHWVDRASKDFLEYLVQAIGDIPILLILVSRDSERDTVIRPLMSTAQRGGVPTVDILLSPLSRPECEHLVNQLVPLAGDEAEELQNCIVARADGNPFFAEEIVRMLIDQGGLVRHESGWQMMPGAKKLADGMPGSLNGLIIARLDRLPEGLRRTLQKAAVLGPVFATPFLGAFCGLDDEQLMAQIESLQDRQFLAPSDQGTGYDCVFRHALIQEAIYGTLLKRDRANLHEQASETIERGEHWLIDQRSEALAYHWSRSAHPVRAVPHLLVAAERAARRCAYETAILYYRQALALVQPSSIGAREAALAAKIGLGRALRFVGEYGEASQILKTALNDLLSLSLKAASSAVLDILVHGFIELANIRQWEGAPHEATEYLEAGLQAMGENPAQEHPQLWRAVIDRMAWVRFRQGDLEGAFSLATRATLGLDVQSQDDPVTLASLYNTLGGILWQQGDLSEAIVYVERSLKLYQGLGYPWGMANAYTNLGILHYAQGNWPTAAANLEQAERLQKQIADLQGRGVTLNNLGTLRQSMGDHASARRDLETSLSIRERLGDAWGAAQAHVALARLSITESRYGEAIAHVEAALSVSEDLGAYEIEARWILALARAEEDLHAGLTTAELALAMARQAGFSEQEADCRRVLGVLHARLGDSLEAESLLRESADLCLQSNVPYGHGLALFELGRLYRLLAQTNPMDQTEWRERARKALAQAMEQFESLGASHDLAQAQALMDQLESEHAATEVCLVASPPLAALSRSTSDGELPHGEWRTATILWVNLEPLPDADEEAVFEALTRIVPSLTDLARESYARAVRRPNGLLVVYGAPIAYEDDAERAVHTAYRMGQYLSEVLGGEEASLRYGIAVSEGRVVAGQAGPDPEGEFGVTGEAAREAEALARRAPPGKVWVTEDVRAATERTCDYEPVAAAPGPDGARRALWALVDAREPSAPPRGLPGIKVRLVGREASFQAMNVLAARLHEGVGGLIWLEGEPGIGKSRLMREFAAAPERTGSLVWAGGCSPQRSGVAFSLFSDLLAQAFGVQSSDTPERIRAQMEQILRSWPRDTQATRPYLELLLGIQPSGLSGERLLGLQPEQLRQQTFVSLRRLFKSLSAQKPLVLLLDDMHWIDPVSAEALQFLLTIVASSPVLFVCAQRRQGADQPNERLLRLQSLIPTQTLQMRLDRLSFEESGMLLDELLERPELPDTLRTMILERGEGNPYFIEEFVRMLIDQGHLERRNGCWVVAPDAVLADIRAPSTLRKLVRSRLDALPPELEQVVECAAVVGASFEPALLQAVVEGVDVSAALRRLELRLLVQRGTETNQWVFGHSLIQDVAYDSLLVAQRKRLHRKIAAALEVGWAGAESDHAEVLAYHYVRAGEGPKALKYLMLAGERAAARYANEEAIGYLEQAAEQLSQQPGAADAMRWRLAASLGDVYRSMGKYADSMVALKAGLALAISGDLPAASSVGLYRRLGETAQKQGELELATEYFGKALSLLGQPVEREAHREAARIVSGIAWVHYLQGRLDQARDTCEASLEHARSADALPELAAAENLMGGIYYRQRDLASALHHTRRAMVLREQMGYTWGVASTLGNLGILAFMAGEWNKSWSFFERSLNLRQEVGDVEGIAICSNNLGILARDRGDLKLAELYFRQSLAMAEPFKMGYHIANSTIGLAQTLLAMGELSAAGQAVEAGLQQAVAIGAEDIRAEGYRAQAEILAARGAWREAKALAARSLELAVENGNRALEASVQRVLSEIEFELGDLSAARQAVDTARQVMESVTNELEAGRIAAQAGRIDLAEGRNMEGETYLRQAQQIFVRLGAKPDLGHVESILQRR